MLFMLFLICVRTSTVAVPFFSSFGRARRISIVRIRSNTPKPDVSHSITFLACLGFDALRGSEGLDGVGLFAPDWAGVAVDLGGTRFSDRTGRGTAVEDLKGLSSM